MNRAMAQSIRALTQPMLPRHLRRTIPTPTAFRPLTTPYRSHAPLAALRYHPVGAGSAAPFHTSSRRNDELPKSPFQTFVDVLREELRKNRELQENVKQLQGDVDKLHDSEAMRKARAAYERARVRGVISSVFPPSRPPFRVFHDGGVYLFLCSLLRASKRTRGYALLLRNSKRAVSKSAMLSPRL